VHEDVLYLICLLDLDADSDTVDTRFNKNLLVFVAGDGEGVQ